MVFRRSKSRLALLLGIVLAAGCRSAPRTADPEYADYLRAASEAWRDPDPAARAVSPVVKELAGPHPVEAYVAFALMQNPDIQAARKRIEAIANRVPVAGSLQDPTLGITFFPEEVQTAAGQQELLMTASQKVPWFGKLATRADIVEQDAQVARAQLAAVELATIDQVKRAYYELYFVQQAIKITEADRTLLLQIRQIAQTRFKTGRVSQQDVLRADLEVSNVDNELIRLRQQLESAQARLARVLHIAPQTRLRALDRLPPEQIPRDLERLHRQAIAARPELHAQLAAILRDRRAVDLARLDYFPDVTVGATWIDVARTGLSRAANGRDAVLLGGAINLPVYRRRLDAAVRAAQAQAVTSARQYDSLRDATLQEVMDLFVQARSQEDLLRLFREDILPKARQTVEVSLRAYNVGDVDFLQLVDNWRELLRFEVANERLEAQLRQTLSALERVVGGSIRPPSRPERAGPAPDGPEAPPP